MQSCRTCHAKIRGRSPRTGRFAHDPNDWRPPSLPAPAVDVRCAAAPHCRLKDNFTAALPMSSGYIIWAKSSGRGRFWSVADIPVGKGACPPVGGKPTSSFFPFWSADCYRVSSLISTFLLSHAWESRFAKMKRQIIHLGQDLVAPIHRTGQFGLSRTGRTIILECSG
jgi:hypothetical protein